MFQAMEQREELPRQGIFYLTVLQSLVSFSSFFYQYILKPSDFPTGVQVSFYYVLALVRIRA